MKNIRVKVNRKDDIVRLEVEMSPDDAKTLQLYLAFCNENIADEIQYQLWNVLED